VGGNWYFQDGACFEDSSFQNFHYSAPEEGSGFFPPRRLEGLEPTSEKNMPIFLKLFLRQTGIHVKILFEDQRGNRHRGQDLTSLKGVNQNSLKIFG